MRESDAAGMAARQNPDEPLHARETQAPADAPAAAPPGPPPPPTPPAPPGAGFDDLWAGHPPVIGHYVIDGVIGAGGFGTVYRGTHRWLRVPAAIKVIQCHASDRVRANFRREAQRQARLQAHPGIAQVRDFGFYTDARVSDRLPYYVMDLIPGSQGLTDYADRAGLGIPERLALVAQICDAVQYAHERGILHLDLKPGNILVYPPTEGRPAQPKVIDFGIARAADPAMEIRARRGVTGTITYMSPEQTDPAMLLDFRSDVYSLGVVLYELLTGALPYPVPGKKATEAYAIIRETPPDLEGHAAARLPGPIRSILARALAKRTQDRYQSVSELGQDIRAYLRGGVPKASGGGVAASAWAGLRTLVTHQPWIAWAAIVALTVAVTDRVGAPLIYRWSNANAWFEGGAIASPLATLKDVLVVGSSAEVRERLAEVELDPGNPDPDYRARLADLMTRLAELAKESPQDKPRALAFDYAFRKLDTRDTENADARFAAAAARLIKEGVPVVVGVRKEAVEREDDGFPPDAELRKVIARSIRRIGHMKVEDVPDAPWNVPVLQWQQGGIEPLEAISLATVMAALEPALLPHYTLNAPSNRVEVTFASEPTSPGGRPIVVPGKRRSLAISNVEPDLHDPDVTNTLLALPIPALSVCTAATLGLDKVITTDEGLRRCAGKIVIVGDLDRDIHPSTSGDIPGVYGHAAAIQTMLAGPSATLSMPTETQALLIPAAAAIAGLLLPLPILRRREWWPTWAVVTSALIWAAAIALAAALCLFAAARLYFLVNPLVIIFAMLLAAALSLLAALLRRSHTLIPEITR